MNAVTERARAGLLEPSFWRSRAVLDELRREGVAFALLAPVLAEVATHPEPRIRRRVVVWLSRFAEAEPVAPVFSPFLNDSAWEVRRAAVQTVASRSGAAADSVRLLLAAFRDQDAAVREAAAEAIGRLPTGAPAVIEAFTQALGDPDDAVRIAVLAALRVQGPAAACATPALLACLRDDSNEVRRLALAGLAATSAGGENVEETLIAALADDDRSVVHAALEAVGALGGTTAATAVLPFLDAGSATRATAVQALIQLGRRHADLESVLLPLLRDRSPARRQAAALVLAERDSSAAWQVLRADLQDERPSWRRRALMALAWFARRSADLLPDLERGLHDSHARVRSAAVVSLGHLGPRAAPLLGGLIRRLARSGPACADGGLDRAGSAPPAVAGTVAILAASSDRTELFGVGEPSRCAGGCRPA